MSQALTNDKLDAYAEDQSAAVALHVRSIMVSVEGPGSVIFPPTFADDPSNWHDFRYNVDELSDGTKIALIDTVGSQANRIEPLFKEGKNGESANPRASLVPQVEILYGFDGGKSLSIFDAGHRLGDAAVRASSLNTDAREAFLAFLDEGDATKIAKIAPTSLVFGVWDSRDTLAKIPRIVQSTIRADDVEVLTRSAQYNPPIDYAEQDVFTQEQKEKQQGDDKSRLAKRGFVHVPAVKQHGGILVRGKIHRDVTINLIALRRLYGNGKNDQALRRYILGLALVAGTVPIDGFLRVGCLLTLDPDTTSSWQEVNRDGTRQNIDLTEQKSLDYAQRTAEAFGVGKNRQAVFSNELATADIETKTKAS